MEDQQKIMQLYANLGVLRQEDAVAEIKQLKQKKTVISEPVNVESLRAVFDDIEKDYNDGKMRKSYKDGWLNHHIQKGRKLLRHGGKDV